MAEWTLTVAQAHLDAWLAADLALATSQSYQMGDTKLTRADLPAISKQITFWRKEVANLTAGRKSGPRVMRVVPRDL
jgi:hypothetical protein